MSRLVLFAFALVLAQGLSFEFDHEIETAFDDVIPDMEQNINFPGINTDLQWGEDEDIPIVPKEELEGTNHIEVEDGQLPDVNLESPGINTDLQWGDEEIQIVPKEELENGDDTNHVEVEDGQLPDMNIQFPGINTDLQWDDDNPVDIISKDELEERDRENGVSQRPDSVEEEAATGAPESVEEEAATGAPESVEEEAATGAPESVEEEEEQSTGAPESVEEEDQVVEEEEETTGAPESEEAEVEEEEQNPEKEPEGPVFVNPCIKCIAHFKELVRILGEKSAALPF